MIFLVALARRAVAKVAQDKGGILMPQGPVAGYNTLWVNGAPRILG